MPAIYTHTQIAEQSYHKLGSPNYIKQHLNEYMLGCIGLEFFLYHNILNPYKKNHMMEHMDVCMHHHHNVFMMHLLQATAKEVDLMIYFLGFITNYCSNKVMRPFSYYGAEKPEGGYETNDVHKFDQLIDTYYYKKINLAGFPVQNTIFKNIKRASLSKISMMLSIAINKTYGKIVVRSGAIERTFDDANAFTSKLLSDTPHTMPSLSGKDKMMDVMTPPKFVSGNDVMNLSHRAWRSPWNNSNVVNHSVTDLIKMSINRSVDLIQVVNGYYLDEIGVDEVSKSIGNINFDGRIV